MAIMSKAAQKLRDFTTPSTPTRAEIARAVGVSPQAVGKWVSGDAVPEEPKRVQLQRLFGIPADEWLVSLEPADEGAGESETAARTGTDAG